MADRSATEEIKKRLNIIDVVKGYIPELKKRGRNYFAVCPFHAEKTPSFSVNEDLQIFKCFGCGAAGDVFEFVKKIEHTSFPEALEKLAKQAGVEIEQYSIDPELKKKRETTLRINRLTLDIFRHFLVKHKAGGQARGYLKKRGISTEAADKFGLGWAPGDNVVMRTLMKKGFSESELKNAGVIKQGRSGIGDTFWQRLIFPIFNERDDPVGFMGRVIEKDRMPKYLNTPETILYRKGNVLYGLNWAKPSIGKSEFAIITEGTINVIASAEVGRENIIAVLGTGFTPSHARLIDRYTDSVSLAFDADDAGVNATVRAIPIALAQGLEVKVIDIPLGEDVDDCIAEDPKAWLSAAVGGAEAIDWLIDYWKQQIDLKTVSGKARLTNAMAPAINAIPDPVVKESWVNRVAKEVGVKPETVEASLKKAGRRGSSSELEDEISEEVSSRAVLGKGVIEKFMLGLLVQHWDSLRREKRNLKNAYIGKTGFGSALRQLIGQDSKLDFNEVVENLDEATAKICVDVALMDLGVDPSDVVNIWEELIKRLKRKRLEEIVSGLKKRVAKAESKGEVKKAEKYMKKIQDLLNKESSSS